MEAAARCSINGVIANVDEIHANIDVSTKTTGIEGYYKKFVLDRKLNFSKGFLGRRTVDSPLFCRRPIL